MNYGERVDIEDVEKPRRRREVLDAAVQLLGESGIRAVTHSRVDAAAGLPKGSASNSFRTRRALIDGVLSHLAQLERADGGAPAPPENREQFTTALTAMLIAQSGPHRDRTLARYALFVETAHGGESATPLLENRRGFEQWTEAMLARIGAPDPDRSAKFLMATMDGLLLHRLTVDQDLDPAPHVVRAVDACFLP